MTQTNEKEQTRVAACGFPDWYGEPCIVCGRDIKTNRKVNWNVNFDCETGQIISPDARTPGSGIMPIGAECVKTIRKEWRMR